MAAMTAPALRARKGGDKIAMLTAYDFPSAQLMSECQIDAVLVGDSCAMVMMGRDSTLGMTMDEMVHHVKMVSRAAAHPLVVADMPFLSYHISTEEAVRNAGRLIAEGGAQCVKLEGPPSIFGPTIEAIQNASIPVMGHLGLTPQSIHKFGGFKVQGRDDEAREGILNAAKDLDTLGCVAVVLECVPADLAEEITQAISIPTIGIGAGNACDGQVLVMHDILGWGFTRFTKTFADARATMRDGVQQFIQEVQQGEFPQTEHTYK